MVKVFLKGGVWKNSEDEILKAAVMKYGKQQWARVASLLNRKSAKQCKARWHEWLDPSVRKVEWSRAEEEKLLHLAKLMPAQWKTIGPVVGRTAAQCQEHYEKLLDQAAAAGGGGGGDELRSQSQLRPGQIDSHPETKPARPDPIDMDEDEIEMLQEARARLANTLGKKAKRKAREKMLQGAKRLADLQKRRELKAAGLMSGKASKKSRRTRDIDLGVEIPFHKPAPAGFHDVSTEDAQAEHIRGQRKKDVDYHKVNENQYRSRDREAAQAQKREEARLRALERSNMDYVVAQVSKTNDPLATRKRGVLELPAPSVTDTELKKLAKLTAAQQDGAVTAEGSAATQALLGDYSDRPLPTPMRTPMAGIASTHQSILAEASQLRMLEQGQTPLLGGDDPVMMDTEQDTALGAATPRLGSNPTPTNRSVAGQTPLTAAPRDQLGLNKRPHSELGDDASVGASTFATSTNSIRELAREERRAAKRARQELEAALAALPAPQFEYELAAPDVIDDEGPFVETVEEMDAADIEAAERERMKKEGERLYEARSSVVKRADLPRPAGTIPDFKDQRETLAEQLIQDELLTLLRHDAHAFPVVVQAEEDGKKKKKRKKVDTSLPPETPIDYVPEESLDAAKSLLQDELDTMYSEKVLALVAKGESQSDAEKILSLTNSTLSHDGAAGLLYAEGIGWVPSDRLNHLEWMRIEFETLQDATASLRKRNDKTESKLSVKHGGYAKRAEALRHGTLHKFAELGNAKIETDVFTCLRSHEVRGSASRIEGLREEIALLEKDEAMAQKRYGELLLEEKRLEVTRKM
jgi:pre-mRNA-splicing factor CDC5/CEF1